MINNFVRSVYVISCDKKKIMFTFWPDQKLQCTSGKAMKNNRYYMVYFFAYWFYCETACGFDFLPIIYDS